MVVSPDDLKEVSETIVRMISDYRIVTLEGDLGAGKTTLIREICKKLQVADAVVSPTFSIMNTYENAAGEAIHHADLYRLDTLEDAIQVGIEEYLYNQELIFVEWPELIEPILPDKVLKVKVEHIDPQTRKIVLLPQGISNFA